MRYRRQLSHGHFDYRECAPEDAACAPLPSHRPSPPTAARTWMSLRERSRCMALAHMGMSGDLMRSIRAWQQQQWQRRRARVHD